MVAANLAGPGSRCWQASPKQTQCVRRKPTGRQPQQGEPRTATRQALGGCPVRLRLRTDWSGCQGFNPAAALPGRDLFSAPSPGLACPRRSSLRMSSRVVLDDLLGCPSNGRPTCSGLPLSWAWRRRLAGGGAWADMWLPFVSVRFDQSVVGAFLVYPLDRDAASGADAVTDTGLPEFGGGDRRGRSVGFSDGYLAVPAMTSRH